MRLLIDEQNWATVTSHLLPSAECAESAAFLFGHYNSEEQIISAMGCHLCDRSDLVAQSTDYLELSDDGRARLIKRAHDENACLVELHSHPFSAHAVFSLLDISGLRETVPHMLWRLRGKPYAAVVVARQSFDALVWADDIRHPERLEAIVVGDRHLKPSDSSLRLW